MRYLFDTLLLRNGLRKASASKGFIAFGIILLVLVVVFVLTLGLISYRGKKTLPSVEEFVDEYYEHFNAEDYGYIYENMTDGKFRSTVDFDSFEDSMKKAHKSLGAVKEREKSSWEIDYKIDGPHFSIQYETNRVRQKAMETFVLKRHDKSWVLTQNQISAEVLTVDLTAPAFEIKPDFSLSQIRKGAIIPFDGPDKKVASMATDAFSAEFLAKGGYSVIDRPELDKILKELGLDAIWMLDDASIKKIGEFLGVEAVLVGYVYLLDDKGRMIFASAPIESARAITLSTKIIDVKDGSVLWRDSYLSTLALTSQVSIERQLQVMSKNTIMNIRR